MTIRSFPLGSYMTNCYLLIEDETLNTAIIDPGAQPNKIIDAVEGSGLNVRCILMTHGHFDHTGAVADLQQRYNVPIYINKSEFDVNDPVFPGLDPSAEIKYIQDGDVIKLGALEIEVLHTPGHTPGSCSFKVERSLFTGDTLFMSSCGRTDFPGGSFIEILVSLKKLADLEGDWDVYPGHNRSTTMERERKFNDFVREAYIRLK